MRTIRRIRLIPNLSCPFSYCPFTTEDLLQSSVVFNEAKQPELFHAENL